MDVSVRSRRAFAFGPFRLDALRRVLSRDGEPIILTPTVLDALIYFVENQGRLVTKDELLETLWPGRFVEEANVRQTVFSLRRGLGPEGERMIATAPGRGYRFTEPVRWEDSEVIDTPAAPSALSTAAHEPVAPERAGPQDLLRPWILAMLAVALAVAFGAGVFAWRRATDRPPPGRRVVMADFSNQTREAVFDRSLASLIRIDLGQSPRFDIVSDREAQDALERMTRPRDTPLIGRTASEVCTRTNSDTLIQGSIAAIGRRYLLTLTATDCSGARTLTAEKAEVAGRDDIPAAMDRLIDRVRRRLGESRASIERYDIPLVPETTASLDALKALTEANWLFNHGKLADAVPLLQHTVALDPKFAMAYGLLGVAEIGLGDQAAGAQALGKAYALRETMNEHQRYGIASLYAEYVTKDWLEGIRNLRALTRLYPRDVVAWSNLADAENELGQHAQAVQDARQALALNPSLQNPYIVFVRAAVQDGQTAAAETVASQAKAKGFDSPDLHIELLRLAVSRGDPAAVDRERAWIEATPSPGGLAAEAELALRRGQVKAAAALFARLAALGTQEGAGDIWRPAYLQRLAVLGDAEQARALFTPALSQVDAESYVLAFAALGDPSSAEAAYARALKTQPADTLAGQDFIPTARAVLALRRGDPKAALDALQPALAYRSRNDQVLSVLGAAELAAGDGARAAAAYREILDHPGWAPESVLYPLARLGLARALRLQRDLAGSRTAYAAFAEAMRGADPGLPIVREAAAEARSLGVEPPPFNGRTGFDKS